MLTFESLYRQYAGDVFRFAHWLCGDRLRGLLVGTGIFFTLLPFSFVAGRGHVTWLWSSAPRLAAVLAAVAAFTWTGYWLLRRRLRSTGL